MPVPRAHAPLDLGRPLYVKRASLAVCGRTLAKGEAFAWRELGIAERMVRVYHDARIVGHETTAQTKPPRTARR